jgi:hypothetical protein
MAKKQTRRSVSIRGSTYDQIRRYCERNNVSMSEFVEDRIAMFFGNGGSKEDDEQQERIEPAKLHEAGRIFTF